VAKFADREVDMNAMVPLQENDELKVLGHQIMEMLRDSRSDARRVGRIVDLVPGLASALRTTAEVLAEGRGRVANTAHAIILIGYRRVEQVLRNFFKTRAVEFSSEYTFTSPQTPEAPERTWVDVAARYGTY